MNKGISILLHVAVENVSILLGTLLVRSHDRNSLLLDFFERNFAFKRLFLGAKLSFAFLGDMSHIEDLAPGEISEHFSYSSFTRVSATAYESPLCTVT